jgi:hypothetical protein
MEAGVLETHTATQQWQSFEIRMRRRRIDRCVLRAGVAIEAGVLEDAREALEEVERLDPHEPAIEPLRARLVVAEFRQAGPPAEAVVIAAPSAVLEPSDPGRPAPGIPDGPTPDILPAVFTPTVPDTPLAQTVVPDTTVPDVGFLAIPESPRRVLPAAAAALLIAISGTAGWLLFSRNAPLETVTARADPAVVYDSKSDHQQPAPTSPATASEPAVQVTATAVAAAATSESEPAPVTPVATAADRDNAVNTPVVDPPRPESAPAAETSSNSRTSTAPSIATPPPAPPVDRRPVPASLEPSPSLPDPVPAAPIAAAPTAVPAVAGTDGVALSGTSVTLTPPAVPTAPTPSSTPAVSSPPPAASSPQADEGQVRALLRRYEAAYSALDAAAASGVWPGVDRRALTNAFQALSSQTVSLGRCDVRLSGATAQAECTGTARWQPKVGAGPQTAARHWRFDLRNTGSDWIITRATVR